MTTLTFTNSVHVILILKRVQSLLAKPMVKPYPDYLERPCQSVAKGAKPLNGQRREGVWIPGELLPRIAWQNRIGGKSCTCDKYAY